MQRRSSLPLILFTLWGLILQGCATTPPPAGVSQAITQPTVTQTLPSPLPTFAPGSASTAAPAVAPTTPPKAQSLAPQVASYEMDVRLDPASKTVSGTERITYRNPSQDVLPDLWLHLYLKAFSSPDTLWMRESGGASRGFASDPSSHGDINVSKLTLVDGTDLLASATITDTLMRVRLPQPLRPGQSIDLNATWTSILPRAFIRTGYGGRDNTFFMVGQWYPKMAVYDQGHWDAEPWHANAEFFHDFGSYDVRVAVPTGYVVAGVGVPDGKLETKGNTTTTRFTATDVTDFAFAASPDFRTSMRKAGDVDVVLYYLPEHTESVTTYLDVVIDSLQTYSSWYGAYPHPRLTVVDVPDDAAGAGGMEYPTLVTGGTLGSSSDSRLAEVVSHEVGHQWWPMQTATNEAREPWLDEGLTEYSSERYMAQAGYFAGGSPTFSTQAMTLPATLPAWSYSQGQYGTIVYGKTTVGMWTLEGIVGTDQLHRAMAAYLSHYRFKHPTGADFRHSLEQSLGGNLNWFFDDFMNGTGVIDYATGAITRTAGESTASITRVGTVRAPVDILITLASGAQRREVWDGQETSVTYSFKASDPVTSVQIDPDGKLKAEFDIDNNSTNAGL